MDESEYIIKGCELTEPYYTESLGKYIFQSLVNMNGEGNIIDVSTQKSITYKCLLDRTIRLAYSLKKTGYKKNDIFALCSENNINYFTPIFASLYIGSTMAPVNPTYSHGELLHASEMVTPKIFFCSKLCVEKILKIKSTTNFIERVIVIDGDECNVLEGTQSLNGFIEQYCDNHFNAQLFQPISVDVDEQIAFILCSSGTTGLPKGVMITHTNFNAKINHHCHPSFQLAVPNESFLCILPLFHVFGLVLIIPIMLLGNEVVLIPKFEESLYLKTIQDYRITSLWVAPPLLVFLAKSPLVDNYDLTSVKAIFCGAAPLNKEIEELCKKRLRLEYIRQGYGLTETSAAVTVMPRTENKSGSSGKVVCDMCVKICDLKTGQPVGPRKTGEICIKGVGVMKGYYKNQEETRKAIDDDGWFHSGDIGYYDEDEFIFVVDRLKELIKFKGFQVPPAELEALLLNNPKIQDAGVVGLPDEEAGELPLAFVVKAPGVELTEKEVQFFVAKSISPHKRLRGGVRFLDAIPKNQSGKIQRNELRKLL